MLVPELVRPAGGPLFLPVTAQELEYMRASGLSDLSTLAKLLPAWLCRTSARCALRLGTRCKVAVSRHGLARAVTGCDQHVIVPAQRSGALLRHRCSACVRARTHSCMCCARVASAGLLSRRERAAASSRKQLDGRNGALVQSPARTRCKRILAVCPRVCVECACCIAGN